MSLISDGGTLFTAPFVNNGDRLKHVSFFAWVKFKSVVGFQSIGFLANRKFYYTGLYKASGGVGPLGATQLDDFGQHIISSDPNQAPLSGKWYAVFGSLAIRYSVTFKSTQTIRPFTYTAGDTGQTYSSWDQIQLLGKQTANNAPDDFLSSGSKIAEFAMWNKELLIEQADDMITGLQSPGHIAKENLICYCPLRFNSHDYSKHHHAFMASGTRGFSFDGEHPILNQYTPFVPKIFLFSHGKDASYSEDPGVSSDLFIASPINATQTLNDVVLTSEYLALQNIPASYGDSNGSSDLFIPTGFPGNWSDSAVTKDRIPLLFGNKYDNSVDETTATLDTFTGLGASSVLWSATNGSSDTVIVGPIIRSYLDTAATSDATVPVTSSAQSYSDSVATSDRTLAFMYLATLSDTATTFDVVPAVAFSQFLSLNDTVATTENLTIFFHPKAMSDIISTQTIIDSVLSINQTSRNDFANSTDSFYSNLNLPLNFFDTNPVTDVVITNFMMASAVPHDAGVTSDLVTYISFRTQLIDASGSSTAFSSVMVSTGLQISLSVITSDSVTGKGNFALNLPDIVPTLDTFTGRVGYASVLADTVVTSTSLTETFARVGSLSDAIHSSGDQFFTNLTVARSFADTGTMSDTYPLPSLNARFLADTGFLSEILVPSISNFNYNLTDTIATNDALPVEGEVDVPPVVPIIPPASAREQKLRERWLIDTGIDR